MLLSITSTAANAADLGYLLAKHPAKVQTFSLSHGKAHVFYPEVSPERCTAVLLLDLDPIGLVRKDGAHAESLFDYVNDRPYVCSSFLAVALGQVFRSALNGQCKEKPDLPKVPLPLQIGLESVPCRGGEMFLRALFEPLGYQVHAEALPLDEALAAWGPSSLLRVRLTITAKLSDVLTQLYVLIPVLDNDKHYFVGEDEAKKLLDKGAGWLDSHPKKDAIVFRYLGHRRTLARAVLDELQGEPEPDDSDDDSEPEAERVSLNDTRYDKVVETLQSHGATAVADLGCGDGKLLRRMLQVPQFAKLIGVDVSVRALEIASRRLKLQQLSDSQRGRIELLHGALTYRDDRLKGIDAVALVEVIEHLDEERLPALQAAVFGGIGARLLVVTTPNAEFNRHFATLPAGKMRHSDHRFEWTRAQFAAWAEQTAAAHGYAVTLQGIGPEHAESGAPTQMAVFVRRAP